ncbi:hypothetical protein G6F57_005827 [Rhizopus arrhizus]|uniref:Rab-GAP TBC domain-containing protein n=1 Tax=Rhizopus oryzae TaxID=64495 RepID=A0A9P6X3S8_RHIOR|nr:hypothetical protein G6F23_006940 [Rhizopus arrhizus]KAG1413531.1 hypothetical protein G6F58_007439 [Rhizopus delemar]KAG0759311.1 hypothetical protein G6F24_009158 [Rhizopus arrhizus]KAG0782366.1 hypothetical protein G6F22_009138 [Rhizopus arrhizus]KAG0790694.1 hypothetical protein G6F21_005627 [Rhizopus arrhizus]
MDEMSSQQPTEIVATATATPINKQTTLLLARVERHQNRLKSDPRPVTISTDPLASFQAVLQQKIENRGQLWQQTAHANVEQFYAVYQDLLQRDVEGYRAVIEKEVAEIELSTDQALALSRILQAYSLYDPQVGYCYGMAHLVAPILREIEEREAFATLIRLMELYEMRDLYIHGPSSCLDTFQSLLAQLCPELKHHLDQLRLSPSLYAASWFLSLFTTSPLPNIPAFYDHVFLEGAQESCLRLSVWLMQKSEKKILRCTQTSEILSLFQSVEFFSTYDAVDMMRLNPAVQHQVSQTADLYQTLARLQKENTDLKMQGMEHEAAEMKLTKRNAMLEKRVKRYKVKFAQQVTAAEETRLKAKVEEEEVDEEKKKKDHFDSFVESLKGTGDFGALIAGAIMTDTKLPTLLNRGCSDDDEEEEEDQLVLEEAKKAQQMEAALQKVTSDLVALKLDHFETTQRYQDLYRHAEDLTRQLNQALESQTAMTQKIIYLTSELEDVTVERDQLCADQEQVLEMAMVAKKTATELVVEKMTLSKEVERLEQCVAQLEQEKQAYFMPRETFTEEVFAAHTILFGQQQQQQNKEQRRHTMAVMPQQQPENLINEYKTKFVESELRCRELEKYLAEAKVRLAELESSLLYPPVRRTSSVHLKRSSTASMLARVSSPSTTEPRASIESYASSTTSVTSINSSQCNSKRSSMYSRIWNAFGNNPTPVTPVTNQLKNSILCQEPQII